VEPGNATHGFMDFMLMMGVAGENVRADYTDSLDLFHTMEAYFTWYPKETGYPRGNRRWGCWRGGGVMSKYLIKQVPVHHRRDPDLVERYRADPSGTVTWWEAEQAGVILNCPGPERSHLAGLHRRRTAGAHLA